MAGPTPLLVHVGNVPQQALEGAALRPHKHGFSCKIGIVPYNHIPRVNIFLYIIVLYTVFNCSIV